LAIGHRILRISRRPRAGVGTSGPSNLKGSLSPGWGVLGAIFSGSESINSETPGLVPGQASSLPSFRCLIAWSGRRGRLAGKQLAASTYSVVVTEERRAIFRGTSPNSRTFFLTDPTCRPSAIAISWASTLLRAIALRRLNSALDQSFGRARFIRLVLVCLLRTSRREAYLI